MARNILLKFLRTTKSNLDSQKTAGNLIEGEPYFITDEQRLAIGTATNNYVELAKKSEIGGEAVNIQNLTADKYLTASDAPIQMYTCSAYLNVYLPTTGLTAGQKFVIWNMNAYNSQYYLTIRTTSTDLYYLNPRYKVELRWDGSNWNSEWENNVSIGKSTRKNHENGVGIGNNAYFNYSFAVGVGNSASNNYYSGVGVGNSASNNYNYGVGVGNFASNNYSSGVGVGNSASNNYNYGVGVGNSASHNYSSGVGVGNSAFNNYSSGVGIGNNASSNSKQICTVALGAYSRAERNREIVSTASNSTSNKAQLTIQKYKEQDLPSNGGAWQELFIDGSSARLIIIASSVYQFLIQINAIDKTNFTCKTWEIKGAIKRNASNTTTLVGTPTKTVTGADTGTTNWDVQVSADDTNESLKIEVKHDSANLVRFSLNIFATETRV